MQLPASPLHRALRGGCLVVGFVHESSLRADRRQVESVCGLKRRAQSMVIETTDLPSHFGVENTRKMVLGSALPTLLEKHHKASGIRSVT